MSEVIRGRTVFGLSEVTASIRRTLSDRYQSVFWVAAELIRLNYYSHSGHCFPELVEKRDGKVIAQMRGNLWRNDYQRINQSFLQVLKEPLKDNIKVLMAASVNFDPLYGLSLHIHDIDPSYTLGDLEMEKQETLRRLKAEDLFERNRSLKFPLLPQRIAILSVESSKGYADFLEVLNTNPWGYRFFHLLFPCVLQGDKAVETMRYQLDRVRKVSSHFDLVAIIRGGGDDVGLSCYNQYELAKAVADFPLPVLTGIGHSTNETVVEMVACINAITPTKLAEVLIQKFHDLSVPVENAGKRLPDMVRALLQNNRHALKQESRLLIGQSKNQTIRVVHQLNQLVTQTTQAARHRLVQDAIDLTLTTADIVKVKSVYISSRRQDLDRLEENIRHLSPENVMKRGYSITRLNGKAIRTGEETRAGDTIETELYSGRLTSIVVKTNQPEENE